MCYKNYEVLLKTTFTALLILNKNFQGFFTGGVCKVKMKTVNKLFLRQVGRQVHI